MTPSQEKALLNRVAKDIKAEAEEARKQVYKEIEAGVDPRDAVDNANLNYRGQYAAIFAKALSDILGDDISSAQALRYRVGDKPLSSKLYANERKVRALVKASVTEHVRGYQDSRALAKDLYEGYGFKTEEKLKISTRAKIVPQYMRRLLKDPKTNSVMSKAFAKAQAKALKTGALKAAYTELLRDIDKIEAGTGKVDLEKRLMVAYEEKVRYHANRIAQTELHREYGKVLANDFVDDEAIQFVQFELAPTHPIEDICDYYAKADMYGMGQGIFPVKKAPVPPVHPFCKCQLNPRVDLYGKKAGKFDKGEQSRFFNSLTVREQKLIAGTNNNLEKMKSGQDVTKVWNAGRPKEYKLKTIGEIVRGPTRTSDT